MLVSSLRRALLGLVAGAPLFAQQPTTGRLVGRVIDAETGRGIADAGVQIVGTTHGTATAVDGQFSIASVSSGTVTIQVRRLGYQPKTVTGLQLAAGGVLEQSIALTPAVARIAAQVVTAAAERGSVESALDAQRNATQVISSVTAEQIARSPDANAAQAVQRVSGVSVQDGKYIIVRGLGERYTTTSLNGARVPSPEPERKVVPLDLFPSGLIQSVTTSKTFTPDLPGDFSGAHVDIRTREFPGQRQLAYGLSLGFSDALGKDVAYAPAAGGEIFALAQGNRGLPAAAATAGNLSNTTLAQRNAIINSFRDVWRAGLRDARPNTSIRMSFGGNDRVFGRQLGYLLSGTYAYSQDDRQDGTRAVVGPGLTEINRFAGVSSGESVLWGALLNSSTLFGQHSRVALNAMYNRSADNDARVERGITEEFGLPAELQLLSYVERSVWSGQLAGEHQKGSHGLEWSLTGSGVTRNEPDRSELAYIIEDGPAGERKLWDFTGQGAVRTFSELDELSVEGKSAYRLELGRSGRTVVKVGGYARGTTRESDVRAFAIGATTMPDSIRALPPEELFGGRFTAPDSSVLLLRSLSQGGSYTADDAIYAGFGMIELPVTGSIRLVGGARVEHAAVTVRSMSTNNDFSKVTPTFTDVLPSLALTYRPGEAHTLRLSASRTLARPEYRELSDVATSDPVRNVIQRGNPNLVRTLITNADLRYEWYPRRGEVLSAALFAKRFEHPIERVYNVTSGRPVTTWINAAGATNYGVELEARKDLDVIAGWLARFTAFSSVTLMESAIDLGATAATNPHRAMVGQSPYLVNAGLTYVSPRNRGSATLLFNRVGPRIFEAGTTPFPDAMELARNALDFSLRWPVRNGMTARLDAKNLFDDAYLIRQGSVTREMYRSGRVLQIGVNVQR